MNLVAPTAFKGTMSPLAAARHLAAPGDRLLPLSDGGDGFLECLQHGLGGSIEEVAALDPFGRVRPVPFQTALDLLVRARLRAALHSQVAVRGFRACRDLTRR